MTDPVMHEESLLDTLDCTCGTDNTQRLQAGALMGLINGFDRKLTRDAFIAIAGAALALHTQMAKMYLLRSVRESFRLHAMSDREDGFETALRSSMGDIFSAAQEAHNEMRHLTKMVTECPTTQDKVH